MVVAGLNNPMLTPLAKPTSSGKPATAKASKSSSSEKEAPSFESTLEQTKGRATASSNTNGSGSGGKTSTSENVSGGQAQGNATATNSQNANPNSAPNNSTNGSSNSSAEAAQATPIPSGTPALPTQGVDRMPTAPNGAVISTLNKPEMPIAQDDQVGSLTRRVVWNDFLRKMNDIGVSAGDIMQAFGSLSKEDLSKPPEQTVDKVVMALGLDGQQAMMAKQAFNELIAKTKSKSFGEELTASSRQGNLALLSQVELQRKTLERSLDNMDRNFFMTTQKREMAQMMQPMEPGMQADERMMAQGLAPDALAAQNLMPEAGGPQAMTTNPMAGGPLAMPALAGIAVPTSTPVAAPLSAASTASSPELNALAAQMKAPTAADQKSIDNLIRNFQGRPNAAQVNPDASAVAAAPQAGAKAIATPATAVPMAALGAVGGIFAGGKGESRGGGKDNSSSDESSTAYLGALATDNRETVVNGKNEFQAQMAQNGQPQPQQQMAVPDLMQQAHVMVRDGGGDMKVTLHPDGLGEVAMRVSVDDGKVNVQMITESDEAKKLIERQIGELKSGLTANHLQVESIKVDTATNLGKQLEQQYQDAQRQQAQASMEQFRQDHQGWRRSFFETGTVNPYIGQAEGNNDMRAASGASSKAMSNRRLDLVA